MTAMTAATGGIGAAPATGPRAQQVLVSGQAEKTFKSAQGFEAMAIGQMLQPMFNTVDTSKGLFGGGKGEAAWKPMMVDEMAKMLAGSGGIGIADAVMKEMLHMQETRDAGDGHG